MAEGSNAPGALKQDTVERLARERMVLLEGELRELHAQKRQFMVIAALIVVPSPLLYFLQPWLVLVGTGVGLSLWGVAEYIRRLHVMETEERIADTLARLAPADGQHPA